MSTTVAKVYTAEWIMNYEQTISITKESWIQAFLTLHVYLKVALT